jgi:hypothetical protein
MMVSGEKLTGVFSKYDLKSGENQMGWVSRIIVILEGGNL